jgi:AGZA family xanthine/uracil permease-like MFS transporter
MHKNFYMREVIAGVTTFFTMAYILVVIPTMLSAPGTGMSLSGTLTALVCATFLMNMVSAFVVRLPYVVAPGMGLNVFFAYSLVLGEKIPWPTALGVIFYSSVLFFIISIFPIRQKIVEAIPNNLKYALSGGIGLFLTFLGLKNMGIIVSSPATFVTFGKLNLSVVLGIIGFVIIFFFSNKHKSYAFLLSMILITAAAVFLGLTTVPSQMIEMPNFHSTFFQIDFVGSLKFAFLPAILSVLLTSLFDSISSLIGLSISSGFVDKSGNPLRLKQALLVDSLASIVGSLFGTTPFAVFVESASGIKAGGRTGIVAFVVGLLFLPFLFFAPLVGMIPSFATAPILVFVGILITMSLKNLKIDHLEDYIPVFFAVILMPLTFSITQGVIWGVLSFVTLKMITGKYKEISSAMWVIAGVCLFSLIKG